MVNNNSNLTLWEYIYSFIYTDYLKNHTLKNCCSYFMYNWAYSKTLSSKWVIVEYVAGQNSMPSAVWWTIVLLCWLWLTLWSLQSSEVVNSGWLAGHWYWPSGLMWMIQIRSHSPESSPCASLAYLCVQERISWCIAWNSMTENRFSDNVSYPLSAPLAVDRKIGNWKKITSIKFFINFQVDLNIFFSSKVDTKRDSDATTWNKERNQTSCSDSRL